MPEPTARSSAARATAILFAISVLAITVVLIVMYLQHEQRNPMSEDAIIQANVVHVSPAIPGQLMELPVREGARVKQGDLLFRLDPHNYQLLVDQAEAQLDIAQAALTMRGRHTRAETANASIADQQIQRARTNLALAERTVKRLQPLAAKNYVPQQQLDTALTAERDARVSLAQALSQATAAQEMVGEEAGPEAAVRGAQAAVALAQKSLADTEVRASNDGLIVGLTVAPGERLAPGQSLFTLIDTERWYATAFFVETRLAHIKPGACASVYVLADPDRALSGRVASIGWGVNTEDMISLPRSLPFVQKSLNWVRVAQRFPVRIELDAPPADLMRVGASATVVVRADEQC